MVKSSALHCYGILYLQDGDSKLTIVDRMTSLSPMHNANPSVTFAICIKAIEAYRQIVYTEPEQHVTACDFVLLSTTGIETF